MLITKSTLRQIIQEITRLDKRTKSDYHDALARSYFWTKPHSIEDVDLVTDIEFSTPAIEHLMDVLNNEALKQNSEIYFLLSVTDEETYALDKTNLYGGYPNNWMMRGQYQGPMSGKHVIWLEFRPLGYTYDMRDLDHNELVKKIARTINHELVHYKQLKKQAAKKEITDEEAWAQLLQDKNQITHSPDRSDYLSLHNEIDAYAHEAAEELLDKYSFEDALNILRGLSSGSTSVLSDYFEYLGDDKKKIHAFLSKTYEQIKNMYHN